MLGAGQTTAWIPSLECESLFVYWLPLIVFVPHMLEEYPRFPAWATKHFGITSKAWYVYSHVVLVAAVVLICSWSERSAPEGWGRVFGTALMVTLALNGLFHVVTTILFREYSPGLITGTLLFFPAAGYVLFRTAGEALLTTPQISLSIAIGGIVQAAVIGSLYLHMNIGWRGQRLTSSCSGPDGS